MISAVVNNPTGLVKESEPLISCAPPDLMKKAIPSNEMDINMPSNNEQAGDPVDPRAMDVNEVGSLVTEGQDSHEPQAVAIKNEGVDNFKHEVSVGTNLNGNDIPGSIPTDVVCYLRSVSFSEKWSQLLVEYFKFEKEGPSNGIRCFLIYWLLG